MKRTVHKVNEVPITITPFTPSGQMVFSTIKTITDLDDPTIVYHETLTPDAHEAIKVLKFLDEMNGISWTPKLKDLEVKLRKELHDLMGAK